ncbi:hypothetical protein Pfo_009355 [Paulownia fortunei]|nr:hypothetical protein Pfo_009355 [Paulownia fortunei]
MAARGGILAATVLSCTILPLLASAFLPDIPGLLIPGNDFINSPTQQQDGDINTFPKQKERGFEGGDFLPIFSEPEKQKPEDGEDDSNEPSSAQNEPGGGSKPVEGSGYGAQAPEPTQEGLREGFYEQSCPQTEKVVNDIINKNFLKDPTLAPAIVRLFFHDCFVTGCDASILLDETPTGEDVEKKAPPNGKFIRGFEAIDEIKAQLEAECPGVVSCADILAFTNRDSLAYTGVPSYNVTAGRRDGLASLAKNVKGNIPLPDITAQENIQLFQKKGMSLEELVVLTGAHSIGTAHCTIVSGRFHDPQKSKGMDPGYLIKMQTLTTCENNSQDLPFDPYSQQKMDSRFYMELLKNQALLESDQNLAKVPHANNIMKKLVDDQKGWLAKFTCSIKKLGEVEVLTGNQGEIRKQCRAVN